MVPKELTSRLQTSGLDVVMASSGIQAFWSALKIKPDAIVTDYYMAGGDGHYLLSRIKSTPRDHEHPSHRLLRENRRRPRESADRTRATRPRAGRGFFSPNLFLSSGCWTRYGETPVSPSSGPPVRRSRLRATRLLARVLSRTHS